MDADLLQLLERETGLLVARLRVFTPARYAAAAPPFPSRADAARHLARQLAAAGMGVELAGEPAPELAGWRSSEAVHGRPDPTPVAGGGRPELPELPGLPGLPELPELPDVALADEIAVTGHDLVTALRTTPPDRQVDGSTASVLAARLLAEVLLHRHDLDGAAPGRRVAAAVLAVLAPGTPPDRCLAVARDRCPAYG